MPESDDKALFYSTIADHFDRLMDPYDLSRRLEVVFDLLLPEDIAGRSLLDVGCGTGWFSRRAFERGARVTSLDISHALVEKALNRTPSVCPVVGSALVLPFASGSFDLVVSSEVIEHTSRPNVAVQEMSRVLNRTGLLVLTCPNKLWKWPVVIAGIIHVRPFGGYENFPGYDELRRFATESGLVVERQAGFHPWPFQLRRLNPLSKQVDQRFGDSWPGRLFINQGIRCSKR